MTFHSHVLDGRFFFNNTEMHLFVLDGRFFYNNTEMYLECKFRIPLEWHWGTDVRDAAVLKHMLNLKGNGLQWNFKLSFIRSAGL